VAEGTVAATDVEQPAAKAGERDTQVPLNAVRLQVQ